MIIFLKDSNRQWARNCFQTLPIIYTYCRSYSGEPYMVTREHLGEESYSITDILGNIEDIDPKDINDINVFLRNGDVPPTPKVKKYFEMLDEFYACFMVFNDLVYALSLPPNKRNWNPNRKIVRRFPNNKTSNMVAKFLKKKRCIVDMTFEKHTIVTNRFGPKEEVVCEAINIHVEDNPYAYMFELTTVYDRNEDLYVLTPKLLKKCLDGLKADYNHMTYIVHTPKGLFYAQEAIEKNLGSVVLCECLDTGVYFKITGR